MPQEIWITNSLTHKKERLVPIENDQVRIYACGVTVYDHCHIGHAMQAIYFDMIRSYLEYAGYKVTYVRNYTDVDDKIIDRAKDLGIKPNELAERMVQSAEQDSQALGLRPPDFAPRVSQTIPDIIAMIATLVNKDFAYVTKEGDVYYRVRKNPEYGKLSNRKIDDMLAGSRDIIKGDKEHPLDFALWKHDLTEGASWPSPWGKGRPGWHIECSAMAKKYLGDHFDIHGGGRDLIFPHHENEIAQSESANGCKFANIWIHNGLLTIEKQKMSKSLGNHILLKDFLKDWPAEVLRFAYLQRFYSSNIDFAKDEFSKSRKRLLYYYSTVAQLDELAKKAQHNGQIDLQFDVRAIQAEFHHSMANDFNTPNALAALNKIFKKINEYLSTEKPSQVKSNTAKALKEVVTEVFRVLGLLKMDPHQFIDEVKKHILPELGITELEIQSLISERNNARKLKDFQNADHIRNDLLAKGVELRDTPKGTDWFLKNTDDHHD